MKISKIRNLTAALLFLIIAIISCQNSQKGSNDAESTDYVTAFKVEPFWPKPLPNNWLVGQVSGVAIDSKDHIWFIHRPGSLDPDEIAADQNPPVSICCIAAPPVIEFDQEGNLIQAWGGANKGYDWPKSEHGMFVDQNDNIWIAGSSAEDNQVLKFTREGKFLLQIGEAGKTGGSNDTKYLGRPTDIAVDAETNEVYITDGYGNRRVIVFDAETGEYKRHWGAYGNRPDDADPGAYDPNAPVAQQFRTPVHAVVISNYGLVYICDRKNDRIQIFQKDGTFVKEAFVAKNTTGAGTTWDLDFSADANQTYIYISDGTDQVVWVLRREDLKLIGSFGRSGRYAGQFHWIHNLAVDSKGNIFTTEVQTGKRVQKFRFAGK